MDRRAFIGAGPALAAAPALGADRPDEAHALIRRAMVIDGNLIVPMDPDAPLDAATSAQLRSSGLTAMKLTSGGSGNQTMAETLTEIAETDRGIAASPKLFLKVRDLADFDAAKRSGRLGIITSFEAGEMLEGRIDSIDRFAATAVRVMGLSYNRDTRSRRACSRPGDDRARAADDGGLSRASAPCAERLRRGACRRRQRRVAHRVRHLAREHEGLGGSDRAP